VAGLRKEAADFIEIACHGGPKASKAVQMQISQAMQDWAAAEINLRLEGFHVNLRASPNPKNFAGGWRVISVDVHVETPEHGLVLAVDPKHLQSKTSIGQNWRNTLNDLIAFAANFHARFPMSVVGGMIGFNRAEASQESLDEMYAILKRIAVREKPSDDFALLEAFGLIVYDCHPQRLSPDTPPPGDPLRADMMIGRMVDLLIQRHVKRKERLGLSDRSPQKIPGLKRPGIKKSSGPSIPTHQRVLDRSS
jgi:hypothetical protein